MPPWYVVWWVRERKLIFGKNSEWEIDPSALCFLVFYHTISRLNSLSGRGALALFHLGFVVCYLIGKQRIWSTLSLLGEFNFMYGRRD